MKISNLLKNKKEKEKRKRYKYQTRIAFFVSKNLIILKRVCTIKSDFFTKKL